MSRECSVEGCEREIYRRQWCCAHYQAWLRHGDPTKRVYQPKRQQPQPGDVFGRLTVLEPKGLSKHRQALFLCTCVCGGETITAGQRLLNGSTRSCGCLVRENRTNLRHGHAAKGNKTPTWRSWQAMLSRCKYSSQANWDDYGGRGITVCDRWRNSFEAFLEDVGEKPEWATGGLDRIDVDGNYELGNVRWATAGQQAQNRRHPKKKP